MSPPDHSALVRLMALALRKRVSVAFRLGETEEQTTVYLRLGDAHGDTLVWGHPVKPNEPLEDCIESLSAGAIAHYEAGETVTSTEVS